MGIGNEWVIAIIVAVVVLGGSQIPKWARNLGRAQNEFKRGLKEGAAEDPVETSTDASATADGGK
jgi:sec-independent protein translocase protein TatA